MDWLAIFALFLNVIGLVHWCVVQHCSTSTIRKLESAWVIVVLIGALGGYQPMVAVGGMGLITLLIMQATSVPDEPPEFELELIME